MSLINDALRKAQGERDRAARKTQGIDADVTFTQGDPARERQSLSAGLILGAGLMAVIAAVVIWLTLGGDSTPSHEPEVAQATVPAPAPTPSAQPAQAEPPAAASVQPAPQPTPTPSEVQPAPTEVVAALAPAAAPEPTTPPVPEAKPPVAEVPAQTRPALSSEEEIQRLSFVQELRVSMVRGSGATGRAMIGGRLLREGDVAEPRLGLILRRIEVGRLVFSDVSGTEYAKSF